MGVEIDSIDLVITSETDKAIAGLEKIKEQLNGLKTQLKGVDTKKFKQMSESYQEFAKKLQDAGKNVTASGNIKELQKQIEATEYRLDSLLSKEHKMQTVGGIDQNSKQWRSLQYDIAETCNNLDVFYDRMKKLEAARPKDFWEIPDYKPGTFTTESTEAGVNTEQAQRVEEFNEAVEEMREGLEKIPQAAQPAAQAIENVAKDGAGVERLKGLMSGLSEMFGRIRENLKGSGVESFNESMQDTIDRIQELKRTISGMENGSIAFDADVYENASRSLADCTAQLNDYKSGILETSDDAKRLQSIMSGVGAAMKSAGAAAAKAFGAVAVKSLRTLQATLKRFGASIGSVFDKIGKKIKVAFRLGTLMLLRRAISAFFKEVKEGFDLLARFSDSIGSNFNKNISNLNAGLKQFGNQMIAAFEPILNVVMPILTAFIARLNQAAQAVAQFFAALTGAATWTRAKLNVQNYAQSLDGVGGAAKKANKELQKTIASFDELHVLSSNEDSDSGGAGGINPADYFETETVDSKFKDLIDRIKDMWKNADFTALGKELGDKLAAMLAGIPWDTIKENAQKLGKSLATLINGFLLSEFDGKSLAWWLGNSLAEAFNTAWEFLNQVVSNLDWPLLGKRISDFVKGALDSIDWTLILDTMSKLGKGIADMLNSIFGDTQMWASIGNTFSQALNSLIQLGLDFVRNFDFLQFGTAIGTALDHALNGENGNGGINWRGLGETLGRGVTGLFTSLKGFFDSIDWGQAGINIMTSVGEFFSNLQWGEISGAISSAVKALFDFLYGMIKGVDWREVPHYIVESIGDFLKGFDWSGVMQSLGKLLGASLKATIDALGSIWEMLKKAWGDVQTYFKGYIDKAGGDIIAGLWEGIKDALKSVGSWIKQNIVDPFVRGFKEGFEIASPSGIMKPLGGFILEGFWEGIKDKIGWLVDKIKSLKDDVVDAFKKAFDIGSPSKVFENKIGKWLLPGLMEGVEDTLPTAIRDMKKMTNKFTESISGIVGTMAINIDDSALKNYKPNYGGDFATSTITHKLQKEMTANAVINNTGLNSDIADAVGRGVEQALFNEINGDLARILDDVLSKRNPHIYMDGRQVSTLVTQYQEKDYWRYNATLV